MDTWLFRRINDLAAHTPWAHDAMRFFAKDGIVLFALLLVVGAVGARHRRDLAGVAGAAWAGGAALVALGIGQVIGNLVDRARPYDALDHVLVLVDRTTDFSFPSDHATAVGAVAVGLWFVHRQLGVVAVLGAVFMAFTRVYVGAHYPADVLAGLALGGAVAYAGHLAVVPLLTRLLERIAATKVGAVVLAPAGDPVERGGAGSS